MSASLVRPAQGRARPEPPPHRHAERPIGRRRRGPRGHEGWLQLVQFGIVGTSGYLVNLVVFAVLLHEAGLHYVAAATGSFLLAATWNYLWNRTWTFRRQRGPVAIQGLRFLTVSTTVFGANVAVLTALVSTGVGKLNAQALAIALVTPLNFLGNKLWSFKR